MQRHKLIVYRYSIFITDSLRSEHSIDKSPQNHHSHGAEVPKHASSETTAQFKSFLGEEGYHAPPLSSNLSASEIKQQLFDFSLGTVGNGLFCVMTTDSKTKLQTPGSTHVHVYCKGKVSVRNCNSQLDVHLDN